MAPNSIIIKLQEQVDTLVNNYERLSAECRELVAQCDKLRSEKYRLEQKVREQQKQIEHLELADVMHGGTDGSIERVRARVNNLLREVDRCIAEIKREREK